MSEWENLTPESNLHKAKEAELQEIFKSIDKKGTLFAYGSLLDPQNLKRLLDNSGDDRAPEVYEAKDLEEAGALLKQDPAGIVLLHNVLLDGIRAQIITDGQLLSAYKKKFGEKYPIDDANPEQYLYVRTPIKKEVILKSGEKTETRERERSINGGLIIGLTEEDLERLDKNETMKKVDGVMDGIYMRQQVPKVIIENKNFTPANIEFYGGNVGDFHKFLDPENSAESRLAAISAVTPDSKTSGRNHGELPKSAYWPHSPEHDVRRKYTPKK